ncbi:MAG: NAD-dependent epimerase/dehydratase family protein [Lewinellaceae bacterium]|nr:NAD-dependent epimerase/dehydratase family protein [Lewinellaceae bacterium]
MPPPLLLTGATGFLGQVFKKELSAASPLLTLGRSRQHDICADLSISPPPLASDIGTVLHNAGKAHVVPRTAAEEQEFFQVNHLGTVNLLKGLGQLEQPPRQFVLISTVSVYGREKGEDIAESHPLNGSTPYARSKIQAEAAVQEWCEARGVQWAILRLPLVAGPYPPGNLGAIRRAIARGRYFRIAGNRARKSMVLAEDVARLIPRLEGESGIFNLTDGVHPSFMEIEEAIAFALNKRIPFSLPKGIVEMGGKAGDVITRLGLPFPLTTERLQKMAATLTFSDEKARRELGWTPRPVIPYIRKGGLEAHW